MKKKLKIRRSAKTFAPREAEADTVEVFALDPDAHVVPSSFIIPPWVYSFGVILDREEDAFLARTSPDAYNDTYMDDVIQAKLGEAKADVYAQLSAKLYNVSERRRAQYSKREKLQGQITMLKDEITADKQELIELETAWGNRGPLM